MRRRPTNGVFCGGMGQPSKGLLTCLCVSTRSLDYRVDMQLYLWLITLLVQVVIQQEKCYRFVSSVLSKNNRFRLNDQIKFGT